jgi:hypothetical protein
MLNPRPKRKGTKEQIMARPIKETPFVKGEDARRFNAQLDRPRQVSLEDVRRARDIYRAVTKRNRTTNALTPC